MSSVSYQTDDTIVAIASASGPGLRGIVRLSGPDSLSITARVFRTDTSIPSIRSAKLLHGQIHIDAWGLDVPADCLVWPDERSFTRQPSTELHTWAGPSLLDEIVGELVSAGARLALPGEFTLRAFLAGRLDLAQAEAVLGVINATGEQELKTGLNQLSGGLGRHLDQLRGNLLDLLAHLEAGLDFVEEDIEFVQTDELLRQLEVARRQVDQLLAQLTHRGDVQRMCKVVLAGPPNAGKSSLFNAICREPIALVSEIAGTTRDYVSRRIDVGGVSCELIDTAGLDPELRGEEVDLQAQLRSGEQIAQAELVIDCQPLDTAPGTVRVQTPATQQQIRIITKADCWGEAQRAIWLSERHEPVLWVSSLTGEGITELLETIVAELSTGSANDDPMLVSTAARSRASLQDSLSALDQAIEATKEGWGEELVAAEIRMALEGLGQVTGAVYTDDILDRVFSRFCIGK